MLAAVPTFTIEGVEAQPVRAEVDIRSGLPTFTIVGLPDAAVRESRERVRAALLNSGLDFPLRRLTVNLAPGGIRKAGPAFDLAVAVGVLAASGQVPSEALDGIAVCGELSLGGGLRPVRGALAVAMGAHQAGHRRLIVPVENAGEAALVSGLEIVAVPSVARLVDYLHGRWDPGASPPAAPSPQAACPDLAEVRGQDDAKRALEIAAAGGHNILMLGPFGAGKTMLARRLPGILPPPAFAEAVEIMKIHSVAGLGDGRLVTQRPFRAPHHSISRSGLVGGGAVPRPGEITLAHRGVLFLDELAEFSRLALEALRQPLEEGSVSVTRAQRTLVFPAEFMLVAASNGCPCGHDAEGCGCGMLEKARYMRRLSGPLLDRIDIICRLAAPSAETLLSGQEGSGETSSQVRARVVAARRIQEERFSRSAVSCNARMGPRQLARHVPLAAEVRRSLLRGPAIHSLSARAHHRVLRLARTIADLEGRERPLLDHFEEALAYRLAIPSGGAQLGAAA